jgi:uncharacterized protein (TIGR02757 family)
MAGFYHRFNTSGDFAAFLAILGQALERWGTLEGVWLQAQDRAPGKGTLSDRAGRFIEALLSLPCDRRRVSDGFGYLFARAEGPSACKRLHLFLRWVVRPDDGVDLGLWRTESPASLEYPVDTHILRLARYLGATRRKGADARTRGEITRFFRVLSPDDPVRYDFSLCRLGILKRCPPAARLELCERCELKPGCLRNARMSRLADSQALPSGGAANLA